MRRPTDLRTLFAAATLLCAAAGCAPDASAIGGPEPPVALSVRLIDAETGSPVRGGRAVVYDGDDPIRETVIPPTADGAAFLLPDTAYRRGEWINPRIEVTDCRGYVDRPSSEDCIDVRVGTFTDVLELTVPMRAEAALVVDVNDPAGRPVSGARVWVVKVGPKGFCRSDMSEETEPGRLVVRHVPFIRDSTVQVCLNLQDSCCVCRAAFGPRPATTPTTAMATLDVTKKGEWLPLLSGGGSGPGGRAPRVHRSPGGDAGVVVRLLRQDGSAAPSVPLSLTGYDGGYWRMEGRTDADGRATFSGVPAGDCEAAVYCAGVVAADRTFKSVSGRTTTVEIRPARGADSVVTVLDPDGRPLPGASVEVYDDLHAFPGSGDAHIQDDAGVQQLLQRTDADGRCELRGLHPGRSTVRARWYPSAYPHDLSDDVEFTAGEDVTVRLAPRPW